MGGLPDLGLPALAGKLNKVYSLLFRLKGQPQDVVSGWISKSRAYIP